LLNVIMGGALISYMTCFGLCTIHKMNYVGKTTNLRHPD
jgi:hypothetical protein